VKRQSVRVYAVVMMVVLALLAAVALGGCKKAEIQEMGVSHFSGLAVSVPTAVATNVPAVVVDSAGVSNLFEVRDSATPVVVVNDGGNADFAGTVQIGTGNRYPLEYASASRITYFGLTSTFTGTTQVLSTTHGCSTAVSLVLCGMSTPDDDAGDPAYCVGSVSDGDVTLSALQDDGDAATAGDTAYYIIIGN